jgi:hypothetical protein
MTKRPKPQQVIEWLKEYEEAKAKLADIRVKRNKAIFQLHDRGCGVSYIADIFDMNQPNVSHIINNRERYDI